MKIAIFTDTYQPQTSGVATSIALLADSFRQQGHQVYIFTTTDPKAEDDPYVYRYESFSFPFFKDRRVAYAPPLAISQQIKGLNIDLIHTQTEFSLGYAGRWAAKNLGIPHIHTYHTWYENYLHYIFKGRLIKPEAVRAYMRRFCQEVDLLIAPSQTIAGVLEAYGIEKNIQVIPTGVKIPRQLGQMSCQSLRTQYGIASQAKMLLSVNRLSEEKNLLELLDRFADYHCSQPDSYLVLVGDGPQRNILADRVADLGLDQVVVFTGMLDYYQVTAFYQTADLLVNLSQSETQGLTYIEAVANRLPVVAMASPYLADLMAIGKFGYLLNDTAEFTQIVKQALSKEENYQFDQLHGEISVDNFYKRLYHVYQQELARVDKSSRPAFKVYQSIKKFFTSNNL
ncbi:hypothetical protein AWM75_06445 [Aerococcus urinaehominis]|uniref:Uncharacterized protein n=1 Tax=Aerococcus urinaehominis TaxID=128944 RepID=A0A109RHY5_9LACT|nr:glycosyltransferase [Aerococcus urinaehominis]AMB99641.1 hypothetical protein AWM75_06445 [Aerococcus urinaehominis]SDL88579.1 1,2-diacylglycerol 3-alpha-glucosyltransferase [Aerococcus urinaehominis]